MGCLEKRIESSSLFTKVLAWCLLFALLLGCSGGDGDENISRQTLTDDDDEGVDLVRCSEALEYLHNECGAQFLTSEGEPLPPGEIVAHCGSPEVECIVGCYEGENDCVAMEGCLEGTCGLV